MAGAILTLLPIECRLVYKKSGHYHVLSMGYVVFFSLCLVSNHTLSQSVPTLWDICVTVGPQGSGVVLSFCDSFYIHINRL